MLLPNPFPFLSESSNNSLNNTLSDDISSIYSNIDILYASSFLSDFNLMDISGTNEKENNNKKELFKLIIQVQGQRYCHMVVYDNIVNEEKSLNMDVLEKVWDDNLRSIQGTIDKYISIEKSNNSPDKILGINLSEGYRKYGENLIYQYVDIPSKATVQDVIDAIVEDIIRIKRWFK